MIKLPKYYGVKVNDLEHIPEISFYNNNFYKGFDGDILFGQCDDEDYTTWYLCDPQDPTNKHKHQYFGDSHFVTRGDEIIEEGWEY